MAYSGFSLRLWTPESRGQNNSSSRQEGGDWGRTRGERKQAPIDEAGGVQRETRDFRVQGACSAMSVQCGFHFLALWGDTEGEEGRSGKEGGQGSGRGEQQQQAAGLGDVQNSCCSGSGDPGTQKCGSRLVQGFLCQYCFCLVVDCVG